MTRLTNSAGGNDRPAWFTDGAAIAFETGRDGTSLELVPTGKDEFFALCAGRVRFERGSDGKVSALLQGSARLPRAN